MIRSFANDTTRRVFEGQVVPELPPGLQQRALMKLQMLHAATELRDLAVALGDRIELLDGDRAGKHCIRVQQRGRICFRWEEGHAHDVELFGYH